MKKIFFLLTLLIPMHSSAWTYVIKNQVQSPVEVSIDFNQMDQKTCPAMHFFLARKGSTLEDTREKPAKTYKPEFRFMSDCTINKVSAKRLMTDLGRPIKNPQQVTYSPLADASCAIIITPAHPATPRSGYITIGPLGSDPITFEEENIFEYSPTYSKFKYSKGD